YSLASERPARIISYTGQSHIADLLGELDHWTPAAFEAFLEDLGDGEPMQLLRSALRCHGHTTASAATAAGIDAERLQAWLGGRRELLALAELRDLGEALGLDYRILLPSPRRHERLGLTYCSVVQSARSIRWFSDYEVASMASASHLSGLRGQFMKVAGKPSSGRARLDLLDSTETHYMVLDGE